MGSQEEERQIKGAVSAMSFINDDFLLTGKEAVRLYHEYAKDEPILDFHNHLPPDEIAQDRRFANLAAHPRARSGKQGLRCCRQ